jgi:hypothetical protein
MLAFAVDGAPVTQPTVVRNGNEVREVILEVPSAPPAAGDGRSTR